MEEKDLSYSSHFQSWKEVSRMSAGYQTNSVQILLLGLSATAIPFGQISDELKTKRCSSLSALWCVQEVHTGAGIGAAELKAVQDTFPMSLFMFSLSPLPFLGTNTFTLRRWPRKETVQHN